MKLRQGLGVALCGAALVALSCSADQGSVPGDTSADPSATAADAAILPESTAAATRVAHVRARFRLPTREAANERPGLSPSAAARRAPAPPLAALGAGVATRFEAATGSDAATHVRAVLPSGALRRVGRPARVALPLQATGEVKLEDERSHLVVAFALEHARSARVEVAEGIAIYRGALDGADVIHRVHAEGTEDFVVFETRPAREELRYSVDVSRVPGLRLVSNTLEFLDDAGTPLLRVAPPYVVDAKGARHEAKLAVSGCAYDTSPVGPWGRKITKPGAERCAVRVAWGGDVAYPAMVDPAWTATGSMAVARVRHTASLLLSGKVLVAGGQNAGALASAELYDPAGNAGAGNFAATGSLATGRYAHTASVLLSGKVLVVGGDGGGASAELFDPGAGTFAATGSLAKARRYHTASVLPSGKVLVVAGDDKSPAPATAEVFDPAGNAGAGTFVATGSMVAAARYHHSASVLPSGNVLVAGGGTDPSNSATNTSLASAELFDPAGNLGAGTFTTTGSLATGREAHTASVLPSGKVLIAAGQVVKNSMITDLGSAELYDPAGNSGAGAFAVAGAMTTMRGRHTASVLLSGKVLVAGGQSAGRVVEVFDAATNAGAGAFTPTGALATWREDHTASVLPSGKVLLVGGWSGTMLADAQLYSPGFCADGFCCEADADCGGASYCAHDGSCQPRKSQGAACNAEANCKGPGCGECSSGTCAQGYCCDTACDGVCQACAAALKQSGVADGTCGPTKSGIDPRKECAQGQVCNGSGTCIAMPATCDGNFTTTGPDGTTQACTPYKCQSNGTCRTTCTSISDCVAPTVCDAAGKCVLPPDSSTADDGSCSVVRASAGNARGHTAWLAAIAAIAGLALARPRRRRGQDDNGRPRRLFS